ncbi:MAG: hypothetical protein ACPG51_01640 [Thiolinea sp.]
MDIVNSDRGCFLFIGDVRIPIDSSSGGYELELPADSVDVFWKSACTSLPNFAVWLDLPDEYYSDFIHFNFSEDGCEVSCNNTIDSLTWVGEISAKEYASRVYGTLSSEDKFFSEGYIEQEGEGSLAVGASFVIEVGEILYDKFMEADRRLKRRSDLVLLESKNFVESYCARFNVPEEKRFIISQYLSYFGQFLVDLGIPSDCEVAVHDASLSLSVAPKDREEAIENIHSALAAYLSLADDGELVVLPKDDGIAAVKYQQLLANVEHLRSQLRLAEALISVKDREISLLEQSLSNSRITINGKVEDKLVPTDGLAIKKYEGKFFDIDVPKLWRRITKK